MLQLESQDCEFGCFGDRVSYAQGHAVNKKDSLQPARDCWPSSSLRLALRMVECVRVETIVSCLCACIESASASSFEATLVLHTVFWC